MGVRRALLAVLLALAAGGAASAGPPYVTDDPEPTRSGGWENYAYVTGTATTGATGGQAGIELNYGAGPDLQLSLSAPLQYDAEPSLRVGGGDLNLGAKYRFLHAVEGSWLPDVAVFPALSLPTGARALDSGHPSLFLPVWLEKDFGKWSTFGGGGYTLAPGKGLRDSALVGWAVTRSVTKKLNLGLEIYHQTSAATGGAALTNLGFGAIYQVTHHWALLASAGPGLQNTSRTGEASFYASLQFTN